MTDTSADGSRPYGPPISGRVQLIHVLVLSAFALAQPVYDLLGRNPTFFVYRRWQSIDFLLFVLLLSLLLPICLSALGEVASLLGPKVGRWVRASPVILLAALIPLPLFVRAESASPWLLVTLTALIGASVAWGRERFPLCRQFLSILAPSILVFPAIFLFRDGIREQWLPSSTSWTSGGVGSRAPVVFLVFDGLPTASLMDDRYEVDPIRYPSFSRLAQTSTWYRRATTVDPFTAHSVPAILSGVCWTEPRAPLAQEYPHNVFTHAATGYRFEAEETVTHLCPDELCADRGHAFKERFFPLLVDTTIAFAHAIVPAEWRAGLPATDNAWGDFARGPTSKPWARRSQRSKEIADFKASLARLTQTSPPIFLFAHVVLPHQPFVFLPSGQIYRPEKHESGLTEPWALRHSQQRHLLQLAYVDSLLGTVLDRLDEAGLFDESLIVVTADHGVSFREGQPARDLSDANAIDILSVPLFIKRPGQRLAELRDEAVQTVDILPTISKILELPDPAWADGRPLPAGGGAMTWTPSCPQVRDAPAPQLSLEELFAAADAKTGLFGTGATAGGFPAIGPHPELIHNSIAGSTCADSDSSDDFRYDIERPALFESVDPDSGFVPAEISGFIKGPGANLGVDLALAVNDTVVATTRSYVSGARDVFPWTAIAPEDAFREGLNTVAVFAIHPEDVDCTLRPVRRLGEPWQPSFLNVRLGAWPVPLVIEKGFGKSTTVDGVARRTLRRKASLRIPLSPADAAGIRRLKLELEVLDRSGVNLKIRMNGKTRFEGRLGAGPWVHTLELGPRERPESLFILLHGLSADSPKKRKAVLAVQGIWLLPAED